MRSRNLRLPERVLAVGAHPDDIEILCAGTMAKYAAAGTHVTLCSATNGNRGSKALSMAETGRIRVEECKRSAAVIGADSVCLDIDDCGVSDDLEMRSRFIDLIRKTKPDVVFTHHPEDYHHDHVATSKQVFTASFMASVPLLESALPATDKILPVFYMDTLAGIRFQPEYYVDITETFDAKSQMLARHESQVVWMKEFDNIDLPEFMTTMSRFRGIQCGVAFAEAFVAARAWLRNSPDHLLP